MKKLTILIISFFTVICFATAQEQPVTKMRDVTKEGPLIKTAYYNNNTGQTAGDLIIISAQVRLSGLGVSAVMSTLFLTGAFDNMNNETRTGIAVGSCIAGIGLYVAGEMIQIKAGEKMNLAPASEGIGLALQF